VLENYSPLTHLSTANPVLTREQRLLVTSLPPGFPAPALPAFSPAWITVIGVALLAAALVTPALLRTFIGEAASPTVPLIILSYLLLHAPISLAADLYALVQTISLWHARREQAVWDTVRLTPVDEATLVQTYAAISQMRVWHSVQVETTLRLLVPGVLVMALTVGSWMVPVALLVVGIGVYSAAALGTVALVVALAFVVLKLGIAYLCEPLWRVQVITALGIFAAARYADPAAALFIAGGLTVVVRVVPLLALLGVYMVTLWLLALPIGSFWAGLASALWLAVLALVVIPGGRWVHRQVSTWCLHATSILLRRGE
jgi:hypothetical protein